MENTYIATLNDLCSAYSLLIENDKKNVLLVVTESLDSSELEQIVQHYSNKVNIKFTNPANIKTDFKESSFDAILSGVIGSGVQNDFDLIAKYVNLLSAGGKLIVKTNVDAEEQLVKCLKMCGFLNVASSITRGIVEGSKATYAVGSSDKVTLKTVNMGSVASAWKVDGNDDVETISEDDLLEADDLKKPESTSLKVCATTKKSKACKNCTCGLAEELANEIVDTQPDTANAKSSCGSCYLGDAFRCASCPYLGMPAFKPGEKVQLAGNLLQDDF
ncbi:anamorsin homolog [Adelges cooleyi]|uniref:anamorsin homolog n=1 Tax=Adelges cooleyi TaxID=133065 RepID=UPI00217F848B|nr:anamorsin homolog [Adelges cooleyi]